MKKKRINEFKSFYMINPNLNINKAFREQLEKCMITTFGAIAQPFIRSTLLKKKTIVLALLMFYEKISEKISYIVLSYVTCTIIKNYVCIDYLSCQLKK